MSSRVGCAEGEGAAVSDDDVRVIEGDRTAGCAVCILVADTAPDFEVKT